MGECVKNTEIYSIRKNNNGNIIKRGDICICDFDKFEDGAVMYKKRPVLALSENHFNTVICIPFTTSEMYNLGIGFNLDSSKTSYPRFDRISTISYKYLESTGMNIMTRYPESYYKITEIFYDIIRGRINIIDSINENRTESNDDIDDTCDNIESNKTTNSGTCISNIIKEFINDFYEYSDDSNIFVDTAYVYNDFKIYCDSEQNKIEPPSKQYFDILLSTLGYQKYKVGDKIVFRNLAKKKEPIQDNIYSISQNYSDSSNNENKESVSKTKHDFWDSTGVKHNDEKANTISIPNSSVSIYLKKCDE